MTAPPMELPDGTTGPAPASLLQEDAEHVEVGVHDASRLAWYVTVPLPQHGHAPYSFEFEIEVPANVARIADPWSALQSYARLDVADQPERSGSAQSLEAFRRAVVGVAARLARARNGFVRHCTLLRSSPMDGESHWRPLTLWLEAASVELTSARRGLLWSAPNEEEGALADEFLSLQLWSVLTDCTRALRDARRSFEDRASPGMPSFDTIEARIEKTLADEIEHRRHARCTLAEPRNATELERLVSRMRWLKKHFERVLFLDADSYQVVSRFSGWFSVLMAMLAYLWFLGWEVAVENNPTGGPVGVGSGLVVFALITTIAYASRERLKEVGRNWLAGRVQQMFAQRVTRFRLPGRERPRAGTVASTRESFSQSSAQRPDPVHPQYGPTHDVTLLRFMQRGFVATPPTSGGSPRQNVRFIYRLDLSALFPRLHDAVRGLVLPDASGRLAIVDVPRNYELPLRASLRWAGGAEPIARTLVLNKNGLIRVEETAPPAAER